MWQRSSNLETLGGRERSPRGLCVSERASGGDHRPIAAQWQEPPRGDEDTCDFNSLQLCAREGTRLRVFTPTAWRTRWNVDLRFITTRWHRVVCMLLQCIKTILYCTSQLIYHELKVPMISMCHLYKDKRRISTSTEMKPKFPDGLSEPAQSWSGFESQYQSPVRLEPLKLSSLLCWFYDHWRLRNIT